MSETRLAVYVPRMLLGRRGQDAPGYWRTDGSLLFCDVSGFTRLSEKLARQGKAGAEELVTNLSQVYTALLTATSDGGDVLKFSGDALVIFFDGDDHAARAASTAQGMRRALTEVGAIDTSQGRVRLRMSTGIHSGEFDFFCCGADHLELLAAGPGVSTTVAMEAAADAEEILLSPGTAAALDPRALGAPKAGGMLLRRQPCLPPLRRPDESDTSDDVAARFVPRLLHGRLGVAGAENDHRQVTVGFLQFKGTDALLASEGAQGVFERLQSLTVTVQEATSRYGVCIVATDIDANGGKFMLAAGAPFASEDDEGRMLRAALDILDAGAPLPIRIGVNRGHVFAGDVGARFRRTYSTMGDATNLAARIMGKTPTGGLYAHRDVVANAIATFETEPVPPFTVKGKTAPVDVLLVRRLSSARKAGGPAVAPLTGREEERARLLAAAALAAEGSGTVVELTGDAGAGKTRLVSEALAGSAPGRLVRLSCDPYAQARPYASARELLRTVLDIPSDADRLRSGRLLTEAVARHTPDLRHLTGLLAPVVGADVAATTDEVAPAYRTARTHSFAAQLVAAALRTATVVVDDASWMDEASAALLAKVFGQSREHPWLVIVARRNEETGLHAGLGYPAEQIHLGPLDEQSVRALVDALCADRPVSPRTRAAVVARGGGNPLFLLELVSAARSTHEAALPHSVEAILASRIDQLAIEDRQVLRHLAVVGTRAPLELVTRVLADEGTDAGDRDLWRRLEDFVGVGRRSVRFRSALHRDAAYEGLTFSRRRALHAAVAGHLTALASTGDDLAADLSLHWHHAERHAEAWQWSVRAGDAARAAWAPVEAATGYRRALEAARHVDPPAGDRARVAELLGDAEEMIARYDRAADAYRLARRYVATSDPAVPRIMRKSGVVQERAGHYPAALRWYSRGFTAAERLADDSERAAARAQLAVSYAGVRYRQGRLADCIAWAARAVEDATASGATGVLGNAYYLLDAAYTDLGDPRAARYRDLALPLFEETGDLVGQANVLNNLGVNAYYEGRWLEALDLYARSREVQRRAGNDAGAAMTANNIAEILSDQGRLGEAETLFREARATWGEADYAVGLALVTSNLGRLSARAGRHDEALPLLDEARRRFADMGADAFVVETNLRIAEVHIALGRTVEAWEAATEAQATTGDGILAATAERLRGLALLDSGGAERGRACLRTALAQARELGADYEVALCLENLAEQDEEGATLRAEATAIFDRLGVERHRAESPDGAHAPPVAVVRIDDTSREVAHATAS